MSARAHIFAIFLFVLYKFLCTFHFQVGLYTFHSLSTLKELECENQECDGEKIMQVINYFNCYSLFCSVSLSSLPFTEELLISTFTIFANPLEGYF